MHTCVSLHERCKGVTKERSHFVSQWKKQRGRGEQERTKESNREAQQLLFGHQVSSKTSSDTPGVGQREGDGRRIQEKCVASVM